MTLYLQPRTFHLRRREFNDIANVIPVRSPPKPSRYGVELYVNRHPDERFMKHAERIIWMKFHTAAYLKVVEYESARLTVQRCLDSGKRKHPEKPDIDILRSQYDSLKQALTLCKTGHVLAGIFPSRDIAETKVEEIRHQDAYGCYLPARIVKIP